MRKSCQKNHLIQDGKLSIRYTTNTARHDGCQRFLLNPKNPNHCGVCGCHKGYHTLLRTDPHYKEKCSCKDLLRDKEHARRTENAEQVERSEWPDHQKEEGSYIAENFVFRTSGMKHFRCKKCLKDFETQHLLNLHISAKHWKSKDLDEVLSCFFYCQVFPKNRDKLLDHMPSLQIHDKK
jgi:hypothetical protein